MAQNAQARQAHARADDPARNFNWQEADIAGNLQYVGMDPERIRRTFVARAGANWLAVLNDVLLILAAVGNNHAKLTTPGKVRDPAQGQILSAHIQSLNILESSANKHDLTLPRIGIAFQRRFFELCTFLGTARGQNGVGVVTPGFAISKRFPVELEAEYQQPSLVGLLAHTNVVRAREFHEAFGKAIRKERWTQQDSDNWFAVAQNGFRSDGVNLDAQSWANWRNAAVQHARSPVVDMAFHLVAAAPILREELISAAVNEVLNANAALAVAPAQQVVDAEVNSAIEAFRTHGVPVPAALNAPCDMAAFVAWDNARAAAPAIVQNVARP